MRYLKTALNQRGQALIELVIVLPLFLVFLSGAAALLNYATLPIWLDELTNLSLRHPETGDLHSKLKRSREGSMIPPYPAPQDLKKSTETKNLFRISLPLHRNYPGQKTITEISLKLSRLFARALFPFGYFPGVDGPILNGFQMVSLKGYQAGSIKDQIRRILIPGSAMEAISGKLGALGLQFVHVNLDAISEEKDPGDQSNEN